MSRSLNTSLTVLLVLLAVVLLGGETIRPFTLTLFVGIAVGTYSSVFVATPLLDWWQEVSKGLKSKRPRFKLAIPKRHTKSQPAKA
jgi:preprotein translocase subunit SecF